MATTKTEYNLLISCPGDVDSVVKLVNAVIKEFNDKYSDILAIRLNPKHWSNSSYNQSGGSAQDLLNHQFIHRCDAAIAVFWTRFGTPTDKYKSGTEEEIEDMLAAGKQVFLYFCNKPVDQSLLLSDEARTQYQRVKDYQKSYAKEKKGLYADYSSDKEFKKKLFKHLEQHFRPLKRDEDVLSRREPHLMAKGIKGSKLYDSYCIDLFYPNGACSFKKRLEDIKAEFCAISKITTMPRQSGWPYDIGISFDQFVELPTNVIDNIQCVADELGIKLPADFFHLGNLKRKFEPISFNSDLSPSQGLLGSSEEKEKYHRLNHLYDQIINTLRWSKFEREYSSLSCLKLALSNCGTKYDEDIDITLFFPQGCIVSPEQLPVPDPDTCEYIIDKCSLRDLFAVPASPDYDLYEASKRTFSQGNAIGISFPRRNYVQEYKQILSNAFEYRFYKEDERDIVILHIDYLKHNSAVAFPTVLFVSDIPSEVSYEIRSKHSLNVVKGTIKTGDPE